MEEAQDDPASTARRKRPPGARIVLVASLALVALVVCLGGACLVLGLWILVPRTLRSLWVSDGEKARADIVQISSAVDQYVIENDGRYPVGLEALIAPDERGFTFLGRETLPLDPWGRPYLYEPPPPGTYRFRIVTLGADGRPGGVGEDRDLDNLAIRDGGGRTDR